MINKRNLHPLETTGRVFKKDMDPNDHAMDQVCVCIRDMTTNLPMLLNYSRLLAKYGKQWVGEGSKSRWRICVVMYAPFSPVKGVRRDIGDIDACSVI